MLKYSARSLVIAAACAGAFGCGDDDPSTVQPDPASVAKCEKFIADYCPAVADCAIDGDRLSSDDRDAAIDECDAAAKEVLDCSRAVSVSDTYDACMDWLDEPDCDAYGAAIESGDDSPLPDECNEVIRIL
jgi:hypothetical protein